MTRGKVDILRYTHARFGATFRRAFGSLLARIWRAKKPEDPLTIPGAAGAFSWCHWCIHAAEKQRAEPRPQFHRNNAIGGIQREHRTLWPGAVASLGEHAVSLAACAKCSSVA